MWRDYLALFLGMRMMRVLGSCLSYSTIESPRDSGRCQAKAVRFGKISLCLKSSGVNVAPPNKLCGNTHVNGMRGSFVGFSFYETRAPIPRTHCTSACFIPSLGVTASIFAIARASSQSGASLHVLGGIFAFLFVRATPRQLCLQVSPCQEALVIW